MKRQQTRASRTANRRKAASSALVTVLEDRTLLAAPVMLKDINPYSETVSSYPSHFVDMGDKLYFVSHSLNKYGDTYGSVLMVTDGTTAGTSAVAEFGYYGGSVYILAETNGTLFLLAESDDDLGLELWISDGTTAGTTIVKDIHPGWRSSNIGPVAVLNGSLYFWADDGTHGRELWKSDGTSAGTFMVKEFMPGSASGAPDPSIAGQGQRELFAYNGRVYFLARTPEYGEELWCTDGTEAGTTIVRDIRSGPEGATIRSLQFFNDGAYFWANDGVTGSELWKSDGTADGTVLVKDIRPGAEGSSQSAFTQYNGAIYFSANDGVSGNELWKTTGTAGGTLPLTGVNNANAGIEVVQQVNGALLFKVDGAIWRTDGTISGTTLVASNVSIFGPQLVGNTLYFYSGGLWKTDGTTAGTVQITSQYVDDLVAVGDTLYFASIDAAHGNELWKSDGTTAGTVLLKDAWPGTKSSYPTPLRGFQGRLLFSADDGTRGRELWTTDGTVAGTFIMKEVFGPRGYDSFVEHNPFHEKNGELYFLTWEGTNGGLWKTDGTKDGTTRVFSGPASEPYFDVRDLTEVNGVWYFTAETVNHGREVWKYDGTSAEPTLVKNVASGSRSSLPYHLVAGNGVLYFHATASPSSGTEQWRSDGTAAGTVQVRTDTNQVLSPVEITVVTGTAYFSYNRAAEGSELWKIDETTGRAVLFADLLPGPGSSSPHGLTDIDGVLYFATVDSVFGKRLWKSDGTAAGTVVVKEFGLTPTAGPSAITAVGDKVFFQIADDQGTFELWKTDGTAAGTSRVREFLFTQPDPANPYPSYSLKLQSLTDVQGTLYFTAVDNQHGRELWTSDGTEAGTRMVKNITPEPWRIGYRRDLLIAVGDHLYFTADDGLHGTEIWRTDGTAEGTWRFDEIQPGARGDFILDFHLLGETLIIAAATYDHGIEPWAMAINHRPTGLSLTGGTVPENVPQGTVVGVFQSTDSDAGDTFTYSLVAGTGDTGNPAFEIVGGQLRVKSSLNFESQSSYSIRVRTTDSAGEWYEKVFAITVTNVVEPISAAVDVDPANNQVIENSPRWSPVGITIFASDPEGRTVLYSLLDNAGGRFWIHPELGYVLVADGAELDHKTASSHSITVQARSWVDGTISVTTLTINVLEDTTPFAKPELVRDINHATNFSDSGYPYGLVQAGSKLFYSIRLFQFDSSNDRYQLAVSDGTSNGTNIIREFDEVISDFVAVGETLYFISTDSRNGRELWKSDGTAAGTMMVKDIVPGPGGSGIYSLMSMNGMLYFAANDVTTGYELWRSDGTAQGTVRITDINPGSGSSLPNRITQLGDALYFIATDGASGHELWTSDGTAAGTHLVKDINPGPADGLTQDTRFFAHQGTLYFAANDGVHGTELWRSDGTGPGTSLVKDIAPGAASSLEWFFNMAFTDDGRAFFRADDGVHGEELFQSDGSEAGTSMVADIWAGVGDSYISDLTVFGGKVYFGASHTWGQRQLWTSDGTLAGTVMVKSIDSRNAERWDEGNPGSFVVYNGSLYFFGDNRFWKSDGTAAGTVQVAPIAGYQARIFNDEIYFLGTEGQSQDLWKSDGTFSVRPDGSFQGTVRVGDLVPGEEDSDPQDFTVVDGILYFSAVEWTHGAELWRTDGTRQGTWLVKDLHPGTGWSDPGGGRVVNGVFYFNARNGSELWKSDGTEAGTVLVQDFGLSWAQTHVLGALGDKLILSVNDAAHGRELWVSDGTPAGTQLLKDIRPGVETSFAYDFTFAGSTLFFIARPDGSGAHGLWKTDGTPAGTVEIKSFPYINLGTPTNLVSIGETVYFVVNDLVHGNELWVTNGTVAGTHVVKDIFAGSTGASITELTVVGDRIFFDADDGVHGKELWVSDGTEAGTFRLGDFAPGAGGSQPAATGVLNGEFYFSVSDGSHRKLWKTDGTVAGTQFVVDLTLLGLDGAPNAISFRGKLYFESFTGPLNQRVLASTDGTADGTSIVTVIPDRGSLYFPSKGGIVLLGSRIVFAGDTDATGTELWAVDLNSPPTALELQGATISEDSPSGTTVGQFQSVDADADETFTYALVAGQGDDGNPAFEIVGNELRLRNPLDFESQSTYSIRVRTTDAFGLWTEVSILLTVHDFDEFDIGPIVDNDPAANVVAESSASSTPIGITVSASDADGTNNVVTYSLIDSAGGRFLIDPETGIVSTADDGRFDFETATSHSITVRATSEDGSFSDQSFTIQVTDVDEFNVSPIVDNDPAPNRVLEHSPAGTPVGITAFAQDLDGTKNTVTYSLWNTRGGRFTIDPLTGVVSVADGRYLDREVQASWLITVLATSADGSISVRDFTILLQDVNEFRTGPVFDRDPAPNRVAEHSPGGTPVGITGFAIDLDATSSGVTYSLWNTRGGRFAIDPVTGVVTVADGRYLDREVQASWTLTVLASSQDGSISVKDFTIELTDVDEYDVGRVFDLDPAPNSVMENAPNGTTVGITGFGIDLDATNSGITYSLWDTRAGRFAIHSTTGVVTVANGALLNREAQGSWLITIMARSQDGSVSVKDFTIHVSDVDEFDVGQVFDLDTAANSVAENAANGTAVGITGFGIDLDATNSAVTYSLSDTAGGRFAIHPTTGVVSVANGALLDRKAAPGWAITILATSADGSQSHRAFWITLLDVAD